mmetsp:Transcript_11393/g.21974  ORF Transcript_11393/g.21974 Transcript_11393/m.21974 type:complete len:201 (-) Transcript_11393:867-1469(-)
MESHLVCPATERRVLGAGPFRLIQEVESVLLVHPELLAEAISKPEVFLWTTFLKAVGALFSVVLVHTKRILIQHCQWTMVAKVTIVEDGWVASLPKWRPLKLHHCPQTLREEDRIRVHLHRPLIAPGSLVAEHFFPEANEDARVQSTVPWTTNWTHQTSRHDISKVVRWCPAQLSTHIAVDRVVVATKDAKVAMLDLCFH